MIVYKITNKVNGLVYIGQTVRTLKERRYQHHNYCNAKKINTPLYNAMRKYGKSSFGWEIIDRATTVEELNEKEIYWIKHYKSHMRKYGYNIMLGGRNSRMPKKIRLKISKSNTGKVKTAEHIEKIKNSKKGKRHTMLWRLEQSVRLQGRVFTDEHRRKMSEAEMGEKNHQAKLLNNDVIDIKRRILNGESNTEIAKDYPVSHKSISLIRTGKTWRHINP